MVAIYQLMQIFGDLNPGELDSASQKLKSLTDQFKEPIKSLPRILSDFSKQSNPSNEHFPSDKSKVSKAVRTLFSANPRVLQEFTITVSNIGLFPIDVKDGEYLDEVYNKLYAIKLSKKENLSLEN